MNLRLVGSLSGFSERESVLRSKMPMIDATSQIPSSSC